MKTKKPYHRGRRHHGCGQHFQRDGLWNSLAPLEVLLPSILMAIWDESFMHRTMPASAVLLRPDSVEYQQ
eukprot:2895892-Amphidinium_carterae.1